ncbi:NACHT domain-containing protein [Aeromonas hydrophila]|uniref:NACHT domain-containing protein n=1 Tax=Aeromonas hydrophila TaxID=644 RepID=UPI00207C78F3|nr:NACHT domain-containing protein [Aeromonas hydrophila]MCO4209497.1 NACHT domain-containing protein [Aeromonas hydrophila]
MAGIEQQISSGVFKITDGFLNALLGPKIEKVRQWSEDKNLQGELDPDTLSKVMGTYLEKLAKRVAEMTTISFPLQKISISDAYEPLYLSQVGQDDEERQLAVQDVLSMHNHSFIIIDRAGMGKSTFAKHLITQVLFKSERIPLFFELRKVSYEHGLIESIAQELDSIGKPFSRGLFYELVKKGKFIIILDGFDEISIDHQEDIANQIYDLSFKGGDNILFLTSRPQESLPDLIDSVSYQFCPFTKEQAKSLVLRYDNISKLDIGCRLIEQLDSVPSKFIETPLLISLLYRTFGTNNSIADRVCTFYDEIYDALYKGHDLINKNGYVRKKKSNLDFEDFRRLLRALCYYMAVTRKTSFDSWALCIAYINKAIDMSAMKPSSAQSFLDDLMVAVPLMQKEGGEYKFLHKTILEYFAAEHLIYKNNSLEVTQKIFEGKLFPSFNKIFDFIHDISPTLFDNVVTKYHAELLYDASQEDDHQLQLINTLIYQKEVQVAIWQFEPEIINDNGKRRDLIGEAQAPLVELGYYSYATRQVVVNGIDYFVTITAKDSIATFHELAWEQISEVIDIDRNTYVNNYLPIDLLGLNSFVRLTFDMSKQLIKFSELIDMGVGMMAHGRFMGSTPADMVRIFSPIKAKEFLTRLKKEHSIDDEFDELLI